MVARHKFAVGQKVEFLRGRNDLHVPPGIYTIVRQLPIEANDCQYRVKSAHDGHERVMRESQLAADPDRSDRARAEKLLP